MKNNRGGSIISLAIIILAVIIIVGVFIYRFYFIKIEQVKAPESPPTEQSL